MDTRTPRTPTEDHASGFDDGPALSMVKVPSDPAQIIVNHASFRVQLRTPPRSPASRRAAPQSARSTGGPRRRPVVWSGRAAPGDQGATGLLRAVRGSGVRQPGPRDGTGEGPLSGDPGATQVIPRFGTLPALDDSTVETPAIGAPGPLLPPMRDSSGAYDIPPDTQRPYGQGMYGGGSSHGDDFPGATGSAYDRGAGPSGDGTDDGHDDPYDTYEPYEAYEAYDHDGPDGGTGDERAARRGSAAVRHAYYPGRRMNLGVVLLPLRVFLGLISVYAGMGKLCDPVYFDGGERGSMVTWLRSLHPWAMAEPLRDFALHHPVGAGLIIAFLQVLVGVLTVLGLWQRVAAVVGALLSAALLVTVSWRAVPVYDAPDIIYLAAWSPLVIAGAPVYSADGRLASEAWRTLGPRAGLGDLRRRVLRRGLLLAALASGLTFLVGALLGGAVRDADRVTVPGPGEPPHNVLPGSPLPREPRQSPRDPRTSREPSQDMTTGPSHPADTPGAGRETAGAGQPSETQGMGQAPPPNTAPAPEAPATTSAGPSSSGGAGTPSSGGTSTGGEATSGEPGGSDGLVGGLLG